MAGHRCHLKIGRSSSATTRICWSATGGMGRLGLWHGQLTATKIPCLGRDRSSKRCLRLGCRLWAGGHPRFPPRGWLAGALHQLRPRAWHGFEAARRKRPSVPFEVKDILAEEGTERFDYVFANGIFYIKTSDNWGSCNC